MGLKGVVGGLEESLPGAPLLVEEDEGAVADELGVYVTGGGVVGVAELLSFGVAITITEHYQLLASV